VLARRQMNPHARDPAGEVHSVRDGDGPLPGAVQPLIMDPEDPEARDALEGHVAADAGYPYR